MGQEKSNTDLDKKNSIKCPMCGVENPSNSQTCKFCGHIFEDAQLSVEETQVSPQIAEKKMQTSSSSEPGMGGDEKILKSQKDIICKTSRILSEGDLFLTDRRLVYVPDNKKSDNESEQDDSMSLSANLNEVNGISIPLKSIDTILGKRGIIRPSLAVEWHDADEGSAESKKKAEFIQKIRMDRLGEIGNDVNWWESPIKELKTSGMLSSTEKAPAPQIQSDPQKLQSQILDVLGDMQWKGLLQTEREIEEKYQVSLDPDDVEAACKKLSDQKILEQDKFGIFVRRRPPNEERKK